MYRSPHYYERLAIVNSLINDAIRNDECEKCKMERAKERRAKMMSRLKNSFILFFVLFLYSFFTLLLICIAAMTHLRKTCESLCRLVLQQTDDLQAKKPTKNLPKLVKVLQPRSKPRIAMVPKTRLMKSATETGPDERSVKANKINKRHKKTKKPARL